MARWVDYWESHNMPHNDWLSENLGDESLNVKGKFSFLNNKMKFSAKSKLDHQTEGVKAAGDYSLTHTIDKYNKYMVMHKSNNVTLDGNFGLWNKNNVLVSLYVNSVLTQNSEKRGLENKVHVRVHHDNNKIVSLGVEKWDPLSKSTPDVISTWGIFGLETNGYKPFFGANLAYSVSNKKLNYHRLLAGLKQKDWTTYAMASFEGADKKTFTVQVDGKVDKDLKVSGDWKLNMNKDKEGKSLCTTETTLVGEYKVDALTALKAKVSTDKTMALSLTRNFRQLFNLGFTTKLRFNEASETKKSNVGYKFGLLLEINDTLA